MTAVRLRGNDYTQRAIEVHQRNINGETLTTLAEEYGCSHEAMRTWVKHGRRHTAPNMDDRDTQRHKITAILWAEILEATDNGDTKTLPALIDRMAKMNGLDHTHRVQEAQLQLDTARVRLLSTAMTQALEQADIPIPQRRKVLELIANGANG